ncbi:hypothetical protein IWQ56_001806, partial [Coemansia nantahalensis]
CAVLALLGAAPGAAADVAANNTCGPSSRYVVAYYPSWKRQSLMNIDWAKISHLNVAFGIPTDSGEVAFDGEWFLPRLVRDAHKASAKIALSVGGWTGSNRFSTIMGDVRKRGALIKSIAALIEKHELDGVDIDWEYVGRQGSKCNKQTPDDAANFMRFLRALRAALSARFSGAEKTVSLAVRVQPFEDAGGPLKDVSPFAEFVDFASIQAFDINGPWSPTTGPSAPLEHQRNRGAPFSLKQAIDQWLDAKWPADKLVAGVSFHGHSMTTRDVLTAKDGAEMYAPFDRAIPQGDDEDALWYDVCENVNSMSGVWQYKHLRDQGILKTANSTGDEWIRVWDEKSSTPWLYSPQIRRFISYDDPASVQKKVDMARARGLKGIMAWSLHADYNGELLAAISQIGPLCRGPKTDSDPAAASSSSSEQPSSQSSWSPTAPFASLPAPSCACNRACNVVAIIAVVIVVIDIDIVVIIIVVVVVVILIVGSARVLISSSSSSSSASASEGKAILFDSLGSPYMMIGGHSTAVPSDVAEKLMQVGEASATGASDSHKLPSAALDIPVVDNVKTAHMTSFIVGPSKTGLAATNIFDVAGVVPTHQAPEIAGEPQPAAPGFAATFFLALDTSSQPGGQMATTVIAMSQMMASARSGSVSQTAVLQDSVTLAAITSDPLATSTPSSSSLTTQGA